MSEKKPSFLQKIKREAWICLILMAVLLIGSLALHFTGDSDNELSGPHQCPDSAGNTGNPL